MIPLPSPARPPRPATWIAAAGAIALLAACADRTAPMAAAAPHPASFGERVAQSQCGECHSLHDGQASPLADAPPFPVLRGRYSRDAMAQAVEARMQEVHPRMPPLHLDADEVTAFLDYWEGLPAAR